MKEKGWMQRCMADRVVIDGNWEDYMWPHPIDKKSRLDPDLLSFLKRLNLSKLTGIFENEEVLSFEVLSSLDVDSLKDIGIKLGDRKIILNETRKLKPQPTPVKSPMPMSKSFASAAPPPPVREQPASDPPFPLDPELLSFIHQNNLSKVI